jgi:S-formylglutathione hydrolase FrmB
MGAKQFLKNPGKYKSVSAFAPIANPINCPWGQRVFKGYFGEDQLERWKEHDATELIKGWKGTVDILIDVVCSKLFSPLSPTEMALWKSTYRN